MKIELKDVIPGFLEDKPVPGNLWKHNFSMDSPKKYLVNAKSGKGKSTFLSYLFGVRSDFSGTILFDDKNINTFTIDEWAHYREQYISLVFQELRLFPRLTAYENIKLKNDLTHSFETSVTQSMFERLGIPETMNVPCQHLSLGQQQRVAIIRALHQPFKFIFLDEPFSHLDEENTANAFNVIQEHCVANNAALIITSLGSTHGITYDEIFTI